MGTQLSFLQIGTAAPQIPTHVCCGQNGCMDQDATAFESKQKTGIGGA